MSAATQLRRRLLGRLSVAAVNKGIVVSRARNHLALVLENLDIVSTIDGGANAGQFASGLRRAGYTGRIVSVEPGGDAFERLRQAADVDHDWDVVRAAIGPAVGASALFVSTDTVSSSLLPRTDEQVSTFPDSTHARTEDVAMTTVDALLAQHELDPSTTALKLDIQGFESPALDGATDSLGVLPVIAVEMCFVELYAGQVLWPELHARLTSSGYTLWNLEPGWIDRATGRLCWGDGIYVRNDLVEVAHAPGAQA